MDIILRGQYSGEDIVTSMASVLAMFKTLYHIENFCEIHVTLDLLDKQGYEVELVDADKDEPYNLFEVASKEERVNSTTYSKLKLIIDNTRKGS